mmetsp:Transcript_97127/g.243523  ORF Transcript_97127/g.243523 Transcript_97127/m.243523 type:complete len:275 (-) Transcript_97127:254-1078(-)
MASIGRDVSPSQRARTRSPNLHPHAHLSPDVAGSAAHMTPGIPSWPFDDDSEGQSGNKTMASSAPSAEAPSQRDVAEVQASQLMSSGRPSDRSLSPTTPRQLTTPPSTPRRGVVRRVGGSPAGLPSTPARRRPTPLMKALYFGNAAEVSRVLAADPEAAATPFMDHGWEPPLCAATRLGCSSEIIGLLLSHRADVHHEDVHGRTALELLMRSAAMRASTEEQVQNFPNLDPMLAEMFATVRQERNIVARQQGAASRDLLLTAGADASRLALAVH